MKKKPARKEVLKGKIKEIFKKLTGEGMEKNKAAARAIKEATAAIDTMELGAAHDWYKKRGEGGRGKVDAWTMLLEENTAVDVEAMLTTILKYVENAQKNIAEPKYRTVKSSNKFFAGVLVVKWSAAFLVQRLGWDCFWCESVGEVVFGIPRDLGDLGMVVDVVKRCMRVVKDGGGKAKVKTGNLRGTES